MVCLIGLFMPIVLVEIRSMMNISLHRHLFACRVTSLLLQRLTQIDVINPPAFGRKTLLSSGRGPLWRACCYFIVLSVLVVDGDRSLLSFPSVRVARWCGLGFIVVLVSWSSLSSFHAVRQRLFIYMCETKNTRLTGGVSLFVRGWSCPVQFHQMIFDDDCEQTCRFCSVRGKWLRRK